MSKKFVILTIHNRCKRSDFTWKQFGLRVPGNIQLIKNYMIITECKCKDLRRVSYVHPSKCRQQRRLVFILQNAEMGASLNGLFPSLRAT
jgi:hypothetical protein